jgi:hypothetical protein
MGELQLASLRRFQVRAAASTGVGTGAVSPNAMEVSALERRLIATKRQVLGTIRAAARRRGL